jgi:hypothetical protein
MFSSAHALAAEYGFTQKPKTSPQITLIALICTDQKVKAGSPPTRGNASSLLSLVEIEESAGTYFESAGELKNIIEADILFTAFHLSDEITVDLDHGAQLFLGQAPFRAYGTQTCAER